MNSTVQFLSEKQRNRTAYSVLTMLIAAWFLDLIAKICMLTYLLDGIGRIANAHVSVLLYA